MRPFAHMILFAGCLFIAQTGKCSAEEHSAWTVLGQTKIEKNAKNLSAIPFRPEFSLEENNRIQASHRKDTISLTLKVPSDKLLQTTTADHSLVNRMVRLEVNGKVWRGRITAAMISPSSEATVFATFHNHRHSEFDRLLEEETGVLSIGE